MKKYIASAAAFVALVALFGCNKSETDTIPAQDDVKIILNVSGPDADTKVVKTAWTSGDIINIWFDERQAADPDLRIRYDGSKWKVDGELNAEAKAGLKTDGTGTFKYLYVAGGMSYFPSTDLTYYTGDRSYYYDSGTVSGSNLYTTPRQCLSSPKTNPNYTYSAGTLTLNLSEWYFLTNIQVTIANLPSGGVWYLKLYGSGSSSFGYVPKAVLNVRASYGGGWQMRSGSTDEKYVKGISSSATETEFLFNNVTASHYKTASSWSFELTNPITGKTLSYAVDNKLPSAYYDSNPSASNDDLVAHSFSAIKINFSKFSE